MSSQIDEVREAAEDLHSTFVRYMLEREEIEDVDMALAKLQTAINSFAAYIHNVPRE